MNENEFDKSANGEAPVTKEAAASEKAESAPAPEPQKTSIPDAAELKEESEKNIAKQKKQKTRNVGIFYTVATSLLCAVLACMITFLAVSNKYEKLIASVQGGSTAAPEGVFDHKLLEELYSIYEQNYVGVMDEEDFMDYILSAFVLATGDRYGNYMTAEQYSEYIDSLYSKLVGIGINIIEDKENGAIDVIRVFSGSPAAAGGLLPYDLIVAVNGESVKELGYDKATENIKGQEGTDVVLTVVRDGNFDAPITVTCTRASIVAPSVDHKMLEGNIGYLYISGFYSETPVEFENAINELKQAGATSFVFDLRDNTGGLLTAVEKMLDLVVPEGEAVRFVNDEGEELDDPFISDANELGLPMAILVNGYSASGSELFSSSIMDFAKEGKVDATVIGTQTYGKSTVTTPFQMSNGSVVWISSLRFCPPHSDPFEGVGVEPDIVLPLDPEFENTVIYRIPVEKDNQLQKAIEILSGK